MEEKLLFLNRVIIIILILFGIHIFGSDGLSNIKLEGPNHIRLGETLKLKCSFKIEPHESIYAVKWYRGMEEFFRFLPKEIPSKTVFSSKGISVDISNSDDHFVILKNTSIATNGKYKCVVSAEGTFQTIFDYKNISVVVIGYDAPKISLEKQSYHPGEIGRANCTLEKTYPSVNITWYINDKPVEPRHILTSFTPWDLISPLSPPSDLKLTTTHSRLIFNISHNYSPIYLKCKATLYDLYSESAVITIQPNPRVYSYQGTNSQYDPLQRSSINGTYYKGSCGKIGEMSHLHLLAQLFFISIMKSWIGGVVKVDRFSKLFVN